MNRRGLRRAQPGRPGRRRLAVFRALPVILWILGTCVACVSIPPSPTSSPSPPSPEAAPQPEATPAPGQTRPPSGPAQSTPAVEGRSAAPVASPEEPSAAESPSRTSAPSEGTAPGAAAIFVPSGATPDDITRPIPEESRPPAGPGGSATALPAPSRPDGTSPVGGLTLSVAVGPETVSVGDSVTVEIVAASSAEVVDAPLHLAYDTAQLRFLDASEGDYMKKDGGATVFMVNGRSRPGDVAIGIGRNDRTRGVVGSGTLCRVRFKVLAAGTARLAIGPAMAWTVDGTLLPVTTNAAEIRVLH